LRGELTRVEIKHDELGAVIGVLHEDVDVDLERQDYSMA
jgi:hypothetical protein